MTSKDGMTLINANVISTSLKKTLHYDLSNSFLRI